MTTSNHGGNGGNRSPNSSLTAMKYVAGGSTHHGTPNGQEKERGTKVSRGVSDEREEETVEEHEVRR